MSSSLLATHGTKVWTLTPQSIITAAGHDLKLWAHKREVSRKGPEQATPYAFHRDHVRSATSASDLITLALNDRAKGDASSKRETRTIYSDVPLLKAALALLRRPVAERLP